MSWLQKISQSDMFDSMFDTPSPQKVGQDPPQQEPVTITLYRGMDADLDQLERSGDGFILSPHKSEQGMIWFSRDRSVAEGRGEWMLEYPLEAIRHFERVHYENGSTYDQIPDQISQICEPTENCRFYGGIELPEGWLFSYKVEKHIVCSIPLTISKDMLQRVG